MKIFNTPRNLSGVALEQYRKKIDGKFNQDHDSLSDAYYNYWSKGKSKIWNGYDKQKTPQKSKELFDKLHGLLYHKYTLSLVEEHQKTPKNKKDKRFDTRIDKSQIDLAQKSLEKENFDV